MYLEPVVRPEGEVSAPPRITKLSEAIRKGDAMGIPECKRWSGCALGTAAQALGFRANELTTGGEVFGFLMSHLGVTMGVCDKVNTLHCGNLTRLQIADWLESQSY